MKSRSLPRQLQRVHSMQPTSRLSRFFNLRSCPTKSHGASRHHGRLRRSQADGQSLAYVYGRETQADADIANVLTMDEARRIASNIAKLPTYLAANPDANG